MYSLPTLWNAKDQKYPVVPEDVETCSTEAEYRSLKPCDSDIFNLCCHILRRDGLEPAADANTGVNLFIHLKTAVADLL